jgi:hypothetical protein
MLNQAPNPRIRHAIDAGVGFLLRSQDEDGYWRDYQLPPGRSEAWTTACVGCALIATSGYAGLEDAGLHRATAALLAARRPEGWGYNRNTACDADTTSWALRLLGQLGALDGISAQTTLGRYVTPTHHVRTFASVDRFGSWGLEHDEVAPVAGLALLAAHEHRLVEGIRAAIIGSWAQGRWRPFWWYGRAYVCAQSLEFLSGSGGIPDDIARDERGSLAESTTPRSAFEAAQQLTAAVYLVAMCDMWRLGQSVLDSQCEDGGWPMSPVLLVPDQRDPSRVSVHSDDRRLLTTAASLAALTRWAECRMSADPKLDGLSHRTLL